jgi:carboxymethylenebutenolidase
MKAPVQGHYGRRDKTIPTADVQRFEKLLRDRGTNAELFLYDTDSHFHSYHEALYDAEVAKLSWDRTLEFLRKHVR